MNILKLEKYFKALANKKRIKLLLFLLKNGEHQLEQIAEKLSLPYKTVSWNLSVLRTAGFIETRTHKSKAFFKISNGLKNEENYLLSLIRCLNRR